MATDILTLKKFSSETTFEHQYKLSESGRQEIIQQSLSTKSIVCVDSKILKTNGYMLAEEDRQAIIQQSTSSQKIEDVGIEILETNGYLLAEKDRQEIINGSPLAKNRMRIEKMRQEFIKKNGCEFKQEVTRKCIK